MTVLFFEAGLSMLGLRCIPLNATEYVAWTERTYRSWLRVVDHQNMAFLRLLGESPKLRVLNVDYINQYSVVLGVLRDVR